MDKARRDAIKKEYDRVKRERGINLSRGDGNCYNCGKDITNEDGTINTHKKFCTRDCSVEHWGLQRDPQERTRERQ